MSVTIQWVYDEFNGPVSGCGLYNNKQVWFDRIFAGVPPMISSTDVPIAESTAPTAEPEYTLSVVPKDLLDAVFADHHDFCRDNGAPLYHGDPIRVLPHTLISRPNFSTVVPDGTSTIDAKMRSMTVVQNKTRKFAPGSVTGEKIGVIKQSEFTNYFVPRRVETE